MAQAQKLDCTSPQTQSAMNQCAGLAFQDADIALNDAYGDAVAVASDGGDDGGSEERLRAAQRAWIEYRDLACEAEAPSSPMAGSMQPMLYSYCLERLTNARTEDLRSFIATQGSI